MKQFLLFLLTCPFWLQATTLKVGKDKPYKTIQQAIKVSKPGDSILVDAGTYKEGNLNITKPLTILGIGRPILDGEMKYEILSFRANHIVLKGFRIINSGEDEVKNIGALRLYDSHFTTVANNIFENNYKFITLLHFVSRCIFLLKIYRLYTRFINIKYLFFTIYFL